MSQPATVFVVVALVLIAFAAIRLLLRPKRPPTAKFKCARCGTVASHTARTEEAWREGMTRLFCDACHQVWLKSKPPRTGPAVGARMRQARANRGCLSAAVVLLLVPTSIFIAVTYA